MTSIARRFGLLTIVALSMAGCQGAMGTTSSSSTGGSHSGSGGSTGSGGGSGSGSSNGNGSGGTPGSASGGSHGSGSGGSATSQGTGGASTSGTGGSSSSGSGGSSSASCTPLAPITRRLLRVSVEQWGAAVQTLLGLKTAPVLTSRGGEASFAFFSDASLGVDDDMQFNMFTVSQTVLSTIDSTVTSTIAPCSGTSSSAQTTCANSFISTFAQTAYRRPLDTSEVTALMKVYAQGAMQDYKTGIELMIQAVIISPSFVFRTELGAPATADSNGNYPDTTITPYEVASQLGFTLLGTLPDSALVAAAANGSLGTTAGIQTQINRLMALPAVQANITNIILGWFNIGQMFSKTKDTSLLSALSSSEADMTGIENDLFTSTQSFINSILWSGSGKVDDLLTSQTVYVNQRLATLYQGVTYSGGVKAPSSDTSFVSATWPSSQGRSGMLTQPAYLWSASDPSANSIVKRGKGIHDNIVCADPLGAPVDLSTPSAQLVLACTNPNVSGATPDSTCDSEILISDARMTYQPCKTCHSQMDPYSRVLQNFGPIGNYRTVDEKGRAIDPTVTFVPSSPLAGTTLTGVQNFAQALISSGAFDGCSVQQLASYSIASAIRTYDTCELDTIRTQTDGSIKSLISNVLLASFMRTRAGGTK